MLPLHGIVVLDFSHVIAGPFATYYLSTLGARVIKVENPHRGDSIRKNPAAFASLNHGKDIVEIDLATEAGRSAAWKLFDEADVVVDNMRPGVLDKYGLGESTMRARKPAMIYCAISGYGRQGQWASHPAYDHVVQAFSGMSLMSGSPGDGPIKVGFPVIDSVTGILAALAVMAAIRRRDLTGLGESIDVSMLGAALQLMYPMTVSALTTGKAPERVGNVGYSGSPGAETVRCRDGLLAIGANTPQQMQAMGKVLGVADQIEALLSGQVRGFVSGANAEAFRQILHDAMARHSAKDLEARLNEAGVPAACVRDLGECVQDAVAFDMLEPWTLPGEQGTRVPGLGFRANTLFGGKDTPHPALETEEQRS